jgi:Fe-S-cluster containining protein
MPEAENSPPLQGGAGDVAQASQLCIDCGLCCTGAIHDAGVLDDDEIAPAAELGLKLLPESARAGWSFPCAALNGTLCGIFGRRPRCCSRYKCQVLIEMLDGKLTFDEAAARTRQALHLYAEFLAARPDYLSIYDTKVMAKSGLCTPALRDVVEKATALQRYVDRYFRKPTEEKLLPGMGAGKSENSASGQASG